jgi:menaquinone-dependent protoporphyrinogen oxidase
MIPIAVLYATREGHTRRVAEYIAATLRVRDWPAGVVDVRSVKEPFVLGRYAAVVLAASVHRGQHEREMIAFVRRHLEELDRMPAAFLSVSLSERGVEDPAASPEARAKAELDVRAVLEAFFDKTGWRPKHVKPVAGALLYTRYGMLKRLVMKHIVRAEGGPTDTSRDYEFTDWEALDRFVDELVAELSAPEARSAQAS